MSNIPFNPDREAIIEDLYTLSLLWLHAQESDAKHCERVWHFLGQEMSKRAEKLYELHTAEDQQRLKVAQRKVIPIAV